MTTLESMRRIEDLCSRFEAEGKLGEEVVDSLLDQIAPEERTALAKELIALDAELRLKAGDSPVVEDYRKVVDRDEVDCSESLVEQIIDNVLQETNDSISEKPRETERFRFIEQIGRGAYGDVWSAEDKRGGRTLAVKVLRRSLLDDPNAGARLLREALLTGRLQHPGVPPVYDHGTLDDGTAYYAMKLVGGETLESILKARSAENFQLQKCLAIFQSVVQTAAYAHSQGIVHRDLKPQNVMVGDFGEVQVMDWGMAKSIIEDDDLLGSFSSALFEVSDQVPRDASRTPNTEPSSKLDSQQSLTTDGDVLGTPAYMSPEQARGEKEGLDTRSDVFSLGAILYQILTNKRLHEEQSSSEAIHRTATGNLQESLAELDAISEHEDLLEMCRDCLSVCAEDRPPASQVGQVLAAYFMQVEQRARQAELERREMTVRQAETARRRRIQLLAATAITLVSVIGLATALWQRNQAIESQQQLTVALELADQRLDQAQDVVEDFFVEVSDHRGPLASAPGAQKVRQELTKKALDYYDQFLQESGDNPRLQLKIARTYVRLADILNLMSPGGETQEDYLRQALDICNKRLKQEPNQPHALESKSNALQLLSRHYHELGDMETASSHAESAIKSMLRLADLQNTPAKRFAVAQYMQNEALNQLEIGNHKKAAEMCQQAVDIGSAIQMDNPDDVHFAYQLSIIHNTLANVLAFNLGKRDQGMQEYERAIALCQHAQALEPTRPDIQRELAMYQMNLAMVLTHDRKYEEASSRFEGAEEVQQVLVEQNPDVPEYRDSLANTQSNFATFCLSYIKRPELAEQSLTRAAQNYRELMRSAPNVNRYIRDTYSVLLRWAGLRYLLHIQDSDEFVDPKDFAEESIQEISSLMQKRVERTPEDTTYQRGYQSWLLLVNPGADPGPLLELTADIDPKESPESHVNSRALALFRTGRQAKAAELLAESKPDKPGLMRQLLTVLTSDENNLVRARETLQKAESQLKRKLDSDLDVCILYYEAHTKLAAVESLAD